MKRTTVGALLLFVILIGGVLTLYKLQPKLFERGQMKTSDAKATSVIRGAGDNYIGYWFATCPNMRKLLLQKGTRLDWTDDGGAYADRLKKFADKEYDFIVLPVNSYLLHGLPYKFPGVTIITIAESKGADAIVGFADKFPQGKVSELNDPSLRIGYTADSPSSFLLDLTMTDFDLFNLAASDGWRVELQSSREVADKLRKREIDAGVLWEDDLSDVLDDMPELKIIWDSSKFSGYIVDVFVFRREFREKHETEILKFFQSYFQVMRTYANNQEQLVEDFSTTRHKKKDVVRKMLAKVDWYDLEENCEQEFGISLRPEVPASDGLINTIIACTDVLIRTKKVTSDPLSGNPYLITNKGILEKLIKSMPVQSHATSGPVSFSTLNDMDWKELREVGVIRVEPITFQSWGNQLTTDGKNQVDKFAALLVHNYPAYRVAVRGHTGSGGDEKENEKLSLERAEAVVQRLIAVHGIDDSRLHAEGLGSRSLPQKKPGESPRAYSYRLSRVEFVLLEGGRL